MFLRRGICTVVAIGASLAGCCTKPETEFPSTLRVVPISDVLDQIKQELVYAQTEIDGAGSDCADADHKIRIFAYPTKAVLDLKIVNTDAKGATGSVSAPITTGILLGLGGGVTRTNIGTQEITLTLPIRLSVPTRAALQSEISSMQAFVKSRSKMKEEVDGAPAKADFQKEIEAATKNLKADEQLLAEVESKQGPNPASQHPFGVQIDTSALRRNFQTPPQAQAAPDLQSLKTAAVVDASRQQAAPVRSVEVNLPDKIHISDAFKQTISEIIKTKHDGVCFVPQQLDIKANFEATDDKAISGAVTLFVLNLGANKDNKNDYTQSITVTYDLSNGSAVPSGGGGDGS